jgi:hypothetical protein
VPYMLGFAAVLSASAFSFLFRRTFDLFTIAFMGCCFYFLPLLLGHTPDWNSAKPFEADISLPGGVYLVGTMFALASIASAAMFDWIGLRKETEPRPANSLSNWYLLFALVGLIGSISTAHIFDLNKTYVLTQVDNNHWFVVFESAALMAWIDAFAYRKCAQLVLASVLMLVDIAIGFRFATAMAFLSFLVIWLGGIETPLWRSLHRLAAAVVIAFVLLLTINSIRLATLPWLGVTYTELTPETSPKAAWHPLPPPRSAPQGIPKTTVDIVFRIPSLLQQMEPFVTQAILAAVISHNFTCSPPRYRTLALDIPLASRFVGPPMTFENQFKPTLFPRQYYGMAGNVWAEAYCDFGYPGIAAEIVLMMIAIAMLQLLIDNRASVLFPAAVLAGALVAFYIHRNDLQYELLLVRRVVMVFVMAWCARWAIARILKRAEIGNNHTTPPHGIMAVAGKVLVYAASSIILGGCLIGVSALIAKSGFEHDAGLKCSAYQEIVGYCPD